ncbi:MAG: peroxiredoxin family protein [Bacteroidota bacterium]
MKHLHRIRSFTAVLLILLTATFGFMGCSTSPQFEGTYRGLMPTDGGNIAFPLIIEPASDGYQAYVINGIDTVRFTDVWVEQDSIHLRFDYFDSEIVATKQANGDLSGEWTRRSDVGSKRMDFRGQMGVTDRYPSTAPEQFVFDGTWNTTFSDADGNTSPAVGIFVSQPDGKMHGTFARETGDYRFLEGVYTDSTFTLSTFDGSHAYLFKGRMGANNTIEGDAWYYNTSHETFTAYQSDEDPLRDPLQVQAQEAVGETVNFAFPTVNGDTVRATDPQFRDKPLLVYLFGSWCPNCSDEAQLLIDLYEREYKNTDLQIVGLAFEFTGNFKQDAEMVRRYRQRFDIPWTLLIAGSSDKDNAAASLPFLDEVVSYPTSIFTNENHEIQFIHVGFNGPATGSYYYKEKQRLINKLNTITSK